VPKAQDDWRVYVCPGCRDASFWAQVNQKLGRLRVSCRMCDRVLVEVEGKED
jgi:ribosomal protein S27E